MYSRDNSSIGSMLVTFSTNYGEIYVVKDAKFIAWNEDRQEKVGREMWIDSE